MKRPIVLLLAALLLVPFSALPPALAATTDGDGCDKHGHQHWKNPKKHGECRIIYDTVVGPGETKTYDGTYLAVGTVTVLAGGTVNVPASEIAFEDTSGGFIIEPGATFSSVGSILEVAATGSAFQLDARPESTVTLHDTRIIGGGGVSLSTSSASIVGNTLENLSVAIRVFDATLTIEGNTFVGNDVSVNLTGGQPTLLNNHFQGGSTCVRDWFTNPTIHNNTFRGCHVGILHEHSHSSIAGNDLVDEAFPPGAGMRIIGGQSPVIENNRISNYGVGIHIEDSRAFVRNNTIVGNVGHGIFVDVNNAEMDIQGNLIADNGGDGIRLAGVFDLPVTSNTIERNAGNGITVLGSPNAFLADNLVRDNGGDGIVVDAASPGAQLTGNLVTANGGDGIVIRANGTRVNGGGANGNAGHGFDIEGVSDVRVTDASANGNGLDGAFIGRSTLTLTRVNASQNGGNGFTYDPMGPIVLLGETSLASVRAIGNGGSGLHNVRGNLTSASDAWWQDNVRAGVRNDDAAAVIDSRNAFWGSATGPRSSLNPTGTGDRIEGNVLFVPFRTTPPS